MIPASDGRPVLEVEVPAYAVVGPAEMRHMLAQGFRGIGGPFRLALRVMPDAVVTEAALAVAREFGRAYSETDARRCREFERSLPPITGWAEGVVPDLPRMVPGIAAAC